MNRSLIRIAFSLLLCALLFCGTSCALFRKGSRTPVKTLMVTGNFVQPRLLTELVQFRTKQPILVFHQDPGADLRLFYLVRGKCEEIATSKFAEFVEHLNPKSVIVLGDEVCVPAEYQELLRKKFRVMVINSENWELNAQMLGEMMDMPKLNRDFKDYRKRIMDNTLPQPVDNK